MTANHPLLIDGIGDRIATSLREYLDQRTRGLSDLGSGMVDLADFIAAFADSGKRLRSALCWVGWRGMGGDNGDAAIRAAASLELLHAGVLIHDDVIDDSSVRRGQASAHRHFADLHQRANWHGDAIPFGRSAAIVAGDMCLEWSTSLYHSCGLDPARLARGSAIRDLMGTEVMAGQYLDLVTQAEGVATVGRALQVARVKTARYTVERPLQLGAALAGADAMQLERLSSYGLPLGEAFQLRDDVLGLFGDPERTGKPSGDDLREGKQTILIALALEAGTSNQVAHIHAALGNADLTEPDADRIREIIVSTGALQRAQAMIEQRAATARDVASQLQLTGSAQRALHAIANQAAQRLH